jgi:hypothetical protein
MDDGRLNGPLHLETLNRLSASTTIGEGVDALSDIIFHHPTRFIDARLDVTGSRHRVAWTKEPFMSVSVRYIVDDVDDAIAFYRDDLGFEVEMHPAPGFAALSHDDLRLLLNQPGAGGAGIAGGHPRPGGWNRIQISVDDLMR